MPPFIPRKRRHSTPPPSTSASKKAERKATIFDTLDATKATASVDENKYFLASLNETESDSSLSDAGSSNFEDAFPPATKRRKVVGEDEDEETVDWEDAIEPHEHRQTVRASPTGDLELTLHTNNQFGSFTDPYGKKKAPGKLERQIRTVTHCLHVQFLLFHNLIRNAWVCDKELHKILVEQLPTQVKEQVELWKRDSCLEAVTPLKLARRRGKKGSRQLRQGMDDVRGQREWGIPAERQELGVPNMTRGDPILKLMKYLAAYWKKRFRVVVPGLRKQGYKSLEILAEELASFRNHEHQPERHGERILGLEEFRECARRAEGSRDVGAQLFTALVRGIGIEARMVASLQPVGFGWSKTEEASKKKREIKVPNTTLEVSTGEECTSEEKSEVDKSDDKATVRKKFRNTKISEAKIWRPTSQLSGTAGKPQVILDSSDSGLSRLQSSSDDDDSVIDVTASKSKPKFSMPHDEDLFVPNYWTEVISPLTHKVFPVDAIVLMPSVISNPDQLACFEPRGTKAKKALQVFGYVIGYSSDGTAKDVTTRYLKRHGWPGKTKGVRMPVVKMPVLNKRGKIKHYEDYDWFKTVMSGYQKSDWMRTAVDDIEDETDLKAAKKPKKDVKNREETLQGYKQSTKYVLERHLRREEAILPGSAPVKTFQTGKGKKSRIEPVYLREHVVSCRTAESWHKEGRRVKIGECPMKMVPVRAVTLARKREVEEASRDGGEKLKQGLYGWDQTEWIIPPPIENGVIPKNGFGNIDCFVPTMVPKGGVHIPLKGTVRVCKRLGIDYAEAVTGFEFGNQRAVPVITGVIIASEHENHVIEEWKKDEEERRIKEEGKRERAALSMWRKFLMGLRIIERVREDYGDNDEASMKKQTNPFTNRNKTKPPESDQEYDFRKEAKNYDNGITGELLTDIDVSTESPSAHRDPDFTTDTGGGGFLIENNNFLDPEGNRSSAADLMIHSTIL